MARIRSLLAEDRETIPMKQRQPRSPAFTRGDARVKTLRRVVPAVADGAMAVHMAAEDLAGGAEHEEKHKKMAATGPVYIWWCTSGAWILQSGGLLHRELPHYIQSTRFHGLYGADRVAVIRRIGNGV